jgi:hypothetical protein
MSLQQKHILSSQFLRLVEGRTVFYFIWGRHKLPLNRVIVYLENKQRPSHKRYSENA